MSLDPGHTTGWCHIVVDGEGNVDWKAFGQLDTDDLGQGFQAVQGNVTSCSPALTEIVYEDYRVYGWKKEQHAWSELHTPKLIGVIEAISSMYTIPSYKQPAQVAKGFVTDDRLKEWGLWELTKGQRHCRDAFRHGLYFILFGGKDEWKKKRRKTSVG